MRLDATVAACTTTTSAARNQTAFKSSADSAGQQPTQLHSHQRRQVRAPSRQTAKYMHTDTHTPIRPWTQAHTHPPTRPGKPNSGTQLRHLSSGTTWMAEAPVPITTTRLPASGARRAADDASPPTGHSPVCSTCPWNVEVRPGKLGVCAKGHPRFQLSCIG